MSQQLLIVPGDPARVGWPVSALSEIMAVPKLHPLPEAYPHLAGAAFHRGRIISVAHMWSLAELHPPSDPPRLAIRLEPPNDNLALLIPAVEAVIPFSVLEMREEEGGGIWAGLYPWEESWVPVVNPGAVARRLSASMIEFLHAQPEGRSNAS